MKIQIDLTEEQLQLMINALEVTFRFMMKQGSIVADLLAEMPRKEKFENEKRWETEFDRYLITRDIGGSIFNTASYTLYGDDFNNIPDDTHRYSDMWSALRHLQYQLHPHDDGYDTRASEPFAMSDYPMINVELIKED